MASYTTFWSKVRCDQSKTGAGKPLSALFGGPHQSEPGIRKFGVVPGDYIYPITVSAGVLYIVGRLKVSRLLSIEEYVAENAETFVGYESTIAEAITLSNWRKVHPGHAYLAPTCTEEIVLGEGTLLRVMVPVPPDVLEALRYCSQKSERGIKHIVDGRLKFVVSIQGGTYRLSSASAQKFEEMMTDALSD